MDATNVVTSTDTVGIEYHLQGHPAHWRTITPVADNHHALNTPQVNVMTEEAEADPTLGYTRETEVQVTQDTQHRHASRDRNTEWRNTPDRHRTQSHSPHRQRPSNNRPPTPYTRHNSRSRSSSHNNERPHRCSVTIQDNPVNNDDQEYDNVDDYFDEDLN